MNEKKNLKEIIKFRYEKLEKIKQAGYNPYAYNYQKTHDIKDIIKNGQLGIGDHVSIAGRIISFRKMGKASFAHIQDQDGKIQIYLKNDLLPENTNPFACCWRHTIF